MAGRGSGWRRGFFHADKRLRQGRDVFFQRETLQEDLAQPFAGFVYFHLLLANLAEQGTLAERSIDAHSLAAPVGGAR